MEAAHAAAHPSSAPPGKRAAGDAHSGPRIAHTLTACVRCRTRKTRCDPGLPRCGPCERNNAHCEYFDPAKNAKIPRNYVVHLQHKVRDLERQLEELEKDDYEPDAEDVVRGAAAVRIHESDENRFLGPSSGIAIVKLVMQLAKQFTDSKSISDIVPDSHARFVKERFRQEDAKPTSKVYPLVSDVAAEELPTRDLTNLLVQLFYLKGESSHGPPMYPIVHEPSFLQDVEAVYNNAANSYQNFMYAGLADAYYLAALRYLEDAVKPMDLGTIQCFCLIAGYSLTTPTRTAVYYIVGLAVRLAEALGLNEEKTVVLGKGGKLADPLEVDMRRRVFWCILTMDLGLAHSLGRPAIMATRQEHFDLQFFSMVEDHYIQPSGIAPAQPCLKKWIAIHFFRMRLLQLEIRRKLYQKKRPEPKDDQDPWFQQMEAKLIAWRDTSPEVDGGSGLNKVWFVGRYNTMIVFLFRPSPQVSRPSVRAATQCYDACEYNIYMQRKQIETRSVELTWIFTQSIFMAINTMLWSLSYAEVRRMHSREDVERHLKVALDAIDLASERWPGVASARVLYQNLIEACLKVYEKKGDVPISATSPSDSASAASPSIRDDGSTRSRTMSPATVSSGSLSTPPERPDAPFGYISPQTKLDFNMNNDQNQTGFPIYQSPQHLQSTQSTPTNSIPMTADMSSPSSMTNISSPGFDQQMQYNPVPVSFPDLPTWSPSFTTSQTPDAYGQQIPHQRYQNSVEDFSGAPLATAVGALYSDYLGNEQPSWSMERSGVGLNQAQQFELLESLQTHGPEQIESMIEESNALFAPSSRPY
ncbi:Fungal specific transcription factor [Lasiodiplodia theobromae]|uniref:Fungal specific transcription factor n=1 Tax=Lasiodiplodia theobromae TaxID=45133 RepID=UPI0015C2EAD2|nr:Fungal specific transcription factor [Lasiodiplodia theobromae]KAF4537249.1 Fungal specific transcription factor [Lasiodiplodia theobromae]